MCAAVIILLGYMCVSNRDVDLPLWEKLLLIAGTAAPWGVSSRGCRSGKSLRNVAVKDELEKRNLHSAVGVLPRDSRQLEIENRLGTSVPRAEVQREAVRAS